MSGGPRPAHPCSWRVRVASENVAFLSGRQASSALNGRCLKTEGLGGPELFSVTLH